MAGRDQLSVRVRGWGADDLPTRATPRYQASLGSPGAALPDGRGDSARRSAEVARGVARARFRRAPVEAPPQGRRDRSGDPNLRCVEVHARIPGANRRRRTDCRASLRIPDGTVRSEETRAGRKVPGPICWLA